MAFDDDSAHFFGSAPAGAPAGLSEVAEEPAESNLDTGAESSIDGEVAVDVYQTDTDVVIISPIAGVNPDDVELSATEDSVTITGERKSAHTEKKENLITKEIYWGSFSRTVKLPVPCDVDKAEASFKHGILTVKIPKSSKAKKKTITVKSED